MFEQPAQRHRVFDWQYVVAALCAAAAATFSAIATPMIGSCGGPGLALIPVVLIFAIAAAVFFIVAVVKSVHSMRTPQEDQPSADSDS